jgi:hypothetical protein
MATANLTEILNAERSKNSGLTSNGANIAGIINQGNAAVIASAQSVQSGLSKLEQEQKEALAARQEAARVAYQTVQTQEINLAEEISALNVRTAQTKEAQQVLQAEQNKKVEDISKATLEVNNSSFFRNPINWMTSRIKLNDAKSDLDGVSKALVQVHNVIDQEYMTAARNFHDFQTSKVMIAARQTELDAKLKAEKEQMDVQYAAQKANADEKSLQIMATQLKLNPLELERQRLQLQADFADKEKAKDKDIYGIEAFGSAYNLNMADPVTRKQVAASYAILPPEERQKWNSVQLSLLQSKKPLNADSVLSEFRARDDVDGFLKVLNASDPEMHQEIVGGIQLAAKNVAEQKITEGENKGKTYGEVLRNELTLANAASSKKLTPAQIESQVQQQLTNRVLSGGIKSLLEAGTSNVRSKIEKLSANMPSEIVNGAAISVWADQLEGFNPVTIEALKSENVRLAYDTGYSPDNRVSVLAPQASKVLAGIEKLVAMGVSEEEAARAYSTILKKSSEGFIRSMPQAAQLMSRFDKFGIEIPLKQEVDSIDLGFSIFGGAELQSTGAKVDLFNPVELQNLLARAKKQSTAAELNKNIYTPLLPRF